HGHMRIGGVVNGLMYILSTGCQWRAIPTDLPPKSSVYDYFDLWTDDGTLGRIHRALYEQCLERAQRQPTPHRRHHREPKREKRGKRRACIDPHGYDAGKKIKGRS